MTGERFDRIRPPREGLDRRAGREQHGGREELFSGSGAGAATPGMLGFVLECSRCGRSTPLDAGVALRAAIPVFLVLPWREHPIFALCPACGHRAWLRLSGGGGPG